MNDERRASRTGARTIIWSKNSNAVAWSRFHWSWFSTSISQSLIMTPNSGKPIQIWSEPKALRDPLLRPCSRRFARPGSAWEPSSWWPEADRRRPVLGDSDGAQTSSRVRGPCRRWPAGRQRRHNWCQCRPISSVRVDWFFQLSKYLCFLIFFPFPLKSPLPIFVPDF